MGQHLGQPSARRAGTEPATPLAHCSLRWTPCSSPLLGASHPNWRGWQCVEFGLQGCITPLAPAAQRWAADCGARQAPPAAAENPMRDS
eukprot:507338-Prorocentrum_minimum.AAC.7